MKKSEFDSLTDIQKFSAYIDLEAENARLKEQVEGIMQTSTAIEIENARLNKCLTEAFDLLRKDESNRAFMTIKAALKPKG